VPAAVQLPASEKVPTAVGTHLDDVAGELLVGRAESLELTRMHDAAAVGLAQVVAVDVGDVGDVSRRADGALMRRRFTHVTGGPEQFRMGVADVETSDGPAAKISQDGPPGQCVIGVPAHGVTVSVRLPPMVLASLSQALACSTDAKAPGAGYERSGSPGRCLPFACRSCVYCSQIYRSDISIHTIG
jgi:hypothetical protein